jgi:hypothetical protein
MDGLVRDELRELGGILMHCMQEITEKLVFWKI